MPLVIEDGSLQAGANSFVTVAEVRAFATLRASTLTATDPEVEAAAIKAIDFIEALRGQFRGRKVSADQSLQYPRTGATLDGFAIAEDAIPKVLKDAQCQLAIDVLAGTDLQPSGDGREVIREKLDVLETEWKPGAGGNPQPALTKARALLAPLLSTGGGLAVTRA